MASAEPNALLPGILLADILLSIRRERNDAIWNVITKITVVEAVCFPDTRWNPHIQFTCVGSRVVMLSELPRDQLLSVLHTIDDAAVERLLHRVDSLRGELRQCTWPVQGSPG